MINGTNFEHTKFASHKIEFDYKHFSPPLSFTNPWNKFAKLTKFCIPRSLTRHICRGLGEDHKMLKLEHLGLSSVNKCFKIEVKRRPTFS